MLFKHGPKLLLLLALCTLCTGCWDATEIDQLAIVVASGLDIVEDGPQKFLCSLQVALPSELGSNGGGSPTTKTGTTSAYVLTEAKGVDPMSALDIASKRLSRKLFLGERRVLVIGEDCAKQGIHELADEIIRNPQSRLRTYMVIAYHDSAHSILELPYALSRLPSDAIADLESKQFVPEVDAKKFLETLVGHGDPFLLGVERLPTPHNVSDNEDSFGLTHIAVFKKDKLVGWLGGPQLRGFVYIFGRIKRGYVTVNVPAEPGFISARLLHLNTSRHIEVVHGKPMINIRTRCEFDIAENGTSLNLNIPENNAKVRSAIEKEISSEMQSTMDLLQHQYQSDPLGFMEALNKKFPNLWTRIKGEWRQEYSEIPVNVKVKVDIRNSGITGPSIAGTDENTTREEGA